MSDVTLKLPVELLDAVLDYSAHSDVMSASKASKSWRRVARAHPQFFHDFKFYFDIEDPVNCVPYDKAFIMLRQVAQQDGPLQLHVIVRPSTRGLQLHDAKHDALWRALVDLVVGVQPILKALSACEAPRLESLVLSMSLLAPDAWMNHDMYLLARELDDVTIPVTLFMGSAPRLREVIIFKGVVLPETEPVQAFSVVNKLVIRLGTTSTLNFDYIMPTLRELRLDASGFCDATVTMPKMLHNLRIGSRSQLVGGNTIALLVSQVDLSRIRAVDVSFIGDEFDPTPFFSGLPDHLVLGAELEYCGRSLQNGPGILALQLCGLSGDRHGIARRFYSLDNHTEVGAFSLFSSLTPRLVTVFLAHRYIPNFLTLSLAFPLLAHLAVDVSALRTTWFWPIYDGNEFSGVIPYLPEGTDSTQEYVRLPALKELVLEFVPDHPKLWTGAWDNRRLLKAKQILNFCKHLGLHLIEDFDRKPNLFMVKVAHAETGEEEEYMHYFSQVIFK